MNTSTFCGLRSALLHRQPHTLQSIFQKQFLPVSQPSLLRWASSTTNPETHTHEKPRSLLNGPPTTLPAPLSLPTQEASQSTFSYLYKTGRSYLTFYKDGAKNVYTNFVASRAVQERVDKAHNFSIASAVRANALTRSEFLLLHRNNHDIKRVPAFGLVFIICGEFTPLVVIALSNVVPWTCRIPKQINSDRKKLEERRAISFRNLTASPPAAGEGVKGFERQQLIHISWSLGLSSRLWDWLGGQYPGLPNWALRRKAQKTIDYLECDDKLLGDGSRVSELEDEEVRMACVERGIDVLNRPLEKLKADLVAWLMSRESVGVERLLLTR